MKRENSPCFNCNDRKAMCRIGCKKAKEWEEKRKVENQKLYEYMAAEFVMRDYQHQKIQRFTNYKNGKYYGK